MRIICQVRACHEPNFKAHRKYSPLCGTVSCLIFIGKLRAKIFTQEKAIEFRLISIYLLGMIINVNKKLPDHFTPQYIQ